jgi:hypothetical protein
MRCYPARGRIWQMATRFPPSPTPKMLPGPQSSGRWSRVTDGLRGVTMRASRLSRAGTCRPISRCGSCDRNRIRTWLGGGRSPATCPPTTSQRAANCDARPTSLPPLARGGRELPRRCREGSTWDSGSLRTPQNSRRSSGRARRCCRNSRSRPEPKRARDNRRRFDVCGGTHGASSVGVHAF